MKLTLLHKGLILVSIPLCFELLVFSYLINAQDRLELEAQKIDRNKKINDKVIPAVSASRYGGQFRGRVPLRSARCQNSKAPSMVPI